MRSPLLARWERAVARGRDAVVDDRGSTTYARLDAATRRAAAALGGIAPGERVALFVEPGADFVAAFYGIVRAGGCVVVLSPLHPEPETTYFCDDAHVHTIVVSPRFATKLGATTTRDRRVVAVDSLLAADARVDAPPPDGTDSTSAALQLYTSGTTGKPKGAVLTHENLAVQQDIVGAAWRFDAGDVLLHALPLHHMHGLVIALLTALGAGATTRMLPSFDAVRAWNEMEHATVLMAVPTMYVRLFEAFDAADAGTRARWTANARALRLATSGSAALPVTLAERWRAVTGTIPLERYGMTEIGVGTTNPLAGPRKPGHVGLPLPSVETRVVAEGGEDADSGELWIRGPSVFSGYFERPDATRDAFAPGGWFKTGDTVTRDADGHFKILGRTSVDIIKSGGYKLSALEIEEVIRDHAAVKEVAVVGVPDERWGERVVACVVAHPGRADACSADALRAFAKERLAAYKVPKDVVHLDELPRNAIGKVVKPALLDRLRATPRG